MFDNVEKDGYILLGSYPQSQVKDEGITAQLSEKIGVLPTAADSQAWTSYKYYYDSKNDEDYTWFIDVSLDGKKYRGVYFAKYRPYATTRVTENSGYQSDHGYMANTVYWFAYEPIKWRVAEVVDGLAMLISVYALDSTQYDFNLRSCSNHYASSTIRTWLDLKFFNAVFADEEKSVIQNVTVDNSRESTLDQSNPYTCKNTLDKIWLLSAQEALDTKYFKNNDARKILPSDYALSQGCSFDKERNASWCWLRSPHGKSKECVRGIGTLGALDYCSANHTYPGIVPVIKIKLS